MNPEQVQYYGNLRLILSFLGVWPYQSKVSRCLAHFFYFAIAGTQLWCKIAFLILIWPNVNLIMKLASPILLNVMTIIKVLNLIVHRNTIKSLLDEMLTIKDTSTLSLEEIEIVRSHAENGRKFTGIWASYLWGTGILWTSLPLLPQIFSTQGNVTRTLPTPAYYYVDIEEYYYPILTHVFVAILLFMTSTVAGDAIFVVLVEHACGMFSMVGYRLRNSVRLEDQWRLEDTEKSNDITYRNLIDCIHRHREAIKFAEDIESAHSGAFIFTSGIIMITLSFAGVQLLTHSNEFHLIFSHGALISSQMIHLYVENFYSQKLLDYNVDVYDSVFKSNWYDASLRSKKLLYLITMRTMTPCVLTIGGLYVMSMENFSRILRASLSYFTVLRTVQ